MERLIKLGGEDLLGKMLALFLEHLPGRLNTVRESWDEGDWKSLEQAAHSIKSSAGNMGAISMQETASALERNAREKPGQISEGDIDTLFEDFSNAKQFLEDYRKGK